MSIVNYYRGNRSSSVRENDKLTIILCLPQLTVICTSAHSLSITYITCCALYLVVRLVMTLYDKKIIQKTIIILCVSLSLIRPLLEEKLHDG